MYSIQYGMYCDFSSLALDLDWTRNTALALLFPWQHFSKVFVVSLLICLWRCFTNFPCFWHEYSYHRAKWYFSLQKLVSRVRLRLFGSMNANSHLTADGRRSPSLSPWSSLSFFFSVFQFLFSCLVNRCVATYPAQLLSPWMARRRGDGKKKKDLTLCDRPPAPFSVCSSKRKIAQKYLFALKKRLQCA